MAGIKDIEKLKNQLIEDGWESFQEWQSWYFIQKYHSDPEFRLKKLKIQKEYNESIIYDVFSIKYKCSYCHSVQSYKPRNNIAKNPSTRCPTCKKYIPLKKYFQIRKI